MLETLLEKIQKKKVVICALGLGRVGLPLASVFATRGLKVIGVDKDESRLNSIRNGICPFYDPTLQKNLEDATKNYDFKVVPNLNQLNEHIDVILVTVGTPNTVDNKVDYSQLYAALNDIIELGLEDKILILRSTMPPQTTSDIVMPFLKLKTGLKIGEDFAFAVCPERIVEGQAVTEIESIPEIIGGVNDISNKISSELFRLINPKKDMLITTPSGAELVKLFTNIYRYISFAVSNEFAIWAERFGQDATELINIANYNYDRCNIPIPGFVGGPCLSKDGTFLDNNTTFSSIISAAWKLNESIPQHITNNIKNTVGNLVEKKIGVLGISFKAGSDDTRNSPSLKLVEILKSLGADVIVHDPYVKGTESLSNLLQSVEILIFATNHKEFRNLAEEVNHSKCRIIYDVWSMYSKNDFPDKEYMKFGMG